MTYSPQLLLTAFSTGHALLPPHLLLTPYSTGQPYSLQLLLCPTLWASPYYATNC
jgi:hypothetical protein